MKPTRSCNWPPRLDVTLPPDLRGYQPPTRSPRPGRGLHPVMREVGLARFRGRPARQRRFEAVAVRLAG